MTTKERLALVEKARSHLHAATGYNPSGGHYIAVDDCLDELQADLEKELPAGWREIGRVTAGGVSLLNMSLTHKTSGIELFPAIDLAFGVGIPVYAPENCVVDTRDTDARPGEAIYMTGDSGMRYWFAHIRKDLPIGTRLEKGNLISRTIDTTIGGGPHAHIGVNAEAFLGKGKQLKYGRDGNGPDYTLGAPTIRAQLLALDT